ncbi:MAG: hypothetical protein BRD49_02100 [Bacteroidetes bacterium SW_10_40_5]|nr:MAG: hypothetical protein BRD49_02100 [Bacteroidetes bacterium SW_10_40_5]
MNLSKNDYQNLQKLQAKVLNSLAGHFGNSYLTGGTALANYFLHHRYSDDLDLFFNDDPSFKKATQTMIRLLNKKFSLDQDQRIIADSFVRVWILEDMGNLKVEFVNDVVARWDQPLMVGEIAVDNPANILANKLTAIPGREEPKDVFDIVCLALTYDFNWGTVMHESTKKALVAEEDISMLLSIFPVKLLEDQPWLPQKTDLAQFSKNLQTIVDDFLLAQGNSLGKGKTPITEAVPQPS